MIVVYNALKEIPFLKKSIVFVHFVFLPTPSLFTLLEARMRDIFNHKKINK